MNINQLEKKLSESLEYLKSCTDESEANTVAYQGLALCDEILELDSNHVTALISRINLDLHPAINNTSNYIADAETLATNPVFEADWRMYGYECMIYAYNSLLGMPEQAINIIKEQLIEIQGAFTKQFEKHGAEAHALATLGKIHFKHGNKEKAFTIWSKSFDKDPFDFYRNQTAGYHHLSAENWSEATRFLTKYYKYCYNYEDDGFRVALGKELERFLKAGKLDNEPTLIALYYHIVYNEQSSFGIKTKSGFLEHYFQDLLAWGEKYPKSSWLWAAIGNTYFYIENHINAIEAYSKALKGDKPFECFFLDRLYTSCQATDTDFSLLPVPKGRGLAIELYDVATQYLLFYNDESEKLQAEANSKTDDKDYPNKEQSKRLYYYIDGASAYAYLAYKQFKAYIIDETNHDTINNHPDAFSRMCNNYGIIMEKYLRYMNNGDLPIEGAKAKYEVHWNGYTILPTGQNLKACIKTAYNIRLYDKCIEHSYEYEEKYFDVIDIEYRQEIFWYRAISFFELGNKHTELKETFEKAKKVYQLLGKGMKYSTAKFTYIAKLYFIAFKDSELYEQSLPDLLWFLEEEVASEISKEFGVLHSLAGQYYETVEDWETALYHYKKTVEWIKKAEGVEEEDFYWDTMQEAKAGIKKMNKKLGKSLDKGFFGEIS